MQKFVDRIFVFVLKHWIPVRGRLERHGNGMIRRVVDLGKRRGREGALNCRCRSRNEGSLLTEVNQGHERLEIQTMPPAGARVEMACQTGAETSSKR